MEFTVIELLSGFEAAAYFNYFFTVVSIGGWLALGVGILVSIVQKS